MPEVARVVFLTAYGGLSFCTASRESLRGKGEGEGNDAVGINEVWMWPGGGRKRWEAGLWLASVCRCHVEALGQLIGNNQLDGQ